MASGFIPPVNYGLVEEDLHRSGQPNEMNLRFIERLGLNKVIYLSPDDPDMVFMVRVPHDALRCGCVCVCAWARRAP